MIGLAYFDVILFLHFLRGLGTEQQHKLQLDQTFSFSPSLPLPFFLFLSVCQVGDANSTGLFLFRNGMSGGLWRASAVDVPATFELCFTDVQYIPERVYMRVVAVHSCARAEEWPGPPRCRASEE